MNNRYGPIQNKAALKQSRLLSSQIKHSKQKSSASKTRTLSSIKLKIEQQKPQSSVKHIRQTFTTIHRSHRLFYFNSKDEHIRLTLLKAGWKQTKEIRQAELVWICSDSSYSYKHPQLINHFKNNKEITTKLQLLKNMRLAPFESRTWAFFPRSFTISSKQELQDFNFQFNYRLSISLLKKNIIFIKKLRPQLFRKLQYNVRTPQKKLFAKVNKSNNLCLLTKDMDSQFQININLTHLLCKYLRHRCRSWSLQSLEQSKQHFLYFDSKEFQQKIDILIKWNSLQNLFKPCKDVSQVFCKQYYSTPSQYLIYKLIKYFNILSLYEGPNWVSLGVHNIWVMKPCQNSKGSGIVLFTQKQQVFESANNMSGRIIQQYIQSPLLLQLKNVKFQPYNNRKFDIRQWVLVKSLEPLVVYYFSECYLRFCSQFYNLKDLKNLSRHLTNYSINKANYKDQGQSVMSSQVFSKLIGQKRWRAVQRRNMDIVVKTLQACRHNIKHSNLSFQLYGFDILLDSELNSHLLQVNLSPACQERSLFLKLYLQAMSQGLLDIVLERGQRKLFPKWLKIVDQKNWDCYRTEIIDFAVVGSKINTKRYVAFQRTHQQVAALKIQKWWRDLRYS